MTFTLTTSIIMGNSTKNNGGLSGLLGVAQNLIGSLMSPIVGAFGTQTYLPMALTIGICVWASLVLFSSVEVKIPQIKL